jgi:hypothetical protein
VRAGGRVDARARVWSNGRFEVTQVKKPIPANSTLIFEIELLSIVGK